MEKTIITEETIIIKKRKMKQLRRIFMAVFGLDGWLSWCYVIYIALGSNEMVLLNFNFFNEMYVEVVVFTLLFLFFVVCLILELIYYVRGNCDDKERHKCRKEKKTINED